MKLKIIVVDIKTVKFIKREVLLEFNDFWIRLNRKCDFEAFKSMHLKELLRRIQFRCLSKADSRSSNTLLIDWLIDSFIKKVKKISENFRKFLECKEPVFLTTIYSSCFFYPWTGQVWGLFKSVFIMKRNQPVSGYGYVMAIFCNGKIATSVKFQQM